MALEVAEGAVVRHDLEAVPHGLEAAPRPVAPVGAFADEVAEQLGPLVGVQPRHRVARSVLGDRARFEQQRRQQVVLVAVHLGQRDRRAVVGVGAALAQAESLSPALAGSRAGLQVADPLAAAVGPLDAGHEARHHRLDLVEDHLPVAASLRQRVGEQVQDQLLVGLAAREDPHVRQRARRQQPAQQVERLCLDRALVGRRGLVGRARKLLGRPGDDPRQRLRVDREQLVHRLRVAQAELGVVVVAVAARRVGHRRVIGDVARGLLQVGAQPGPLEDLREDVGDPFAGDVRAAELRDRVVAVPEEDPLVQLCRALALAGVAAGARRRHVAGELVEEQPPQRALIARVAREQRALDGLGHVHQREHWPVQVREVGCQPLSLGRCEALNRILQGPPIVPARPGGCGPTLLRRGCPSTASPRSTRRRCRRHRLCRAICRAWLRSPAPAAPLRSGLRPTPAAPGRRRSPRCLSVFLPCDHATRVFPSDARINMLSPALTTHRGGLFRAAAAWVTAYGCR